MLQLSKLLEVQVAVIGLCMPSIEAAPQLHELPFVIAMCFDQLLGLGHPLLRRA